MCAGLAVGEELREAPRQSTSLVSPNPFDNLNGYLYASETLEAAGQG